MLKITKPKTITFFVIASIVFIGVLFFGPEFRIYTDYNFICENTASRKGHRQYFCGLKTHRSYEQSVVEKFIQEKFPDQLRHRWTSYAGKSHYLFGGMGYGHGRPGNILLLPLDKFALWFAKLSETEKKEFYDLLVSDDQKAIQAKIDLVWEELPAHASR